MPKKGGAPAPLKFSVEVDDVKARRSIEDIFDEWEKEAQEAGRTFQGTWTGAAMEFATSAKRIIQQNVGALFDPNSPASIVGPQIQAQAAAAGAQALLNKAGIGSAVTGDVLSQVAGAAARDKTATRQATFGTLQQLQAVFPGENLLAQPGAKELVATVHKFHVEERKAYQEFVRSFDNQVPSAKNISMPGPKVLLERAGLLSGLTDALKKPEED